MSNFNLQLTDLENLGPQVLSSSINTPLTSHGKQSKWNKKRAKPATCSYSVKLPIICNK